MTGRLLFFVALVLIAVALFTCCCASFMPEDEGEGGGVKKNMVRFAVSFLPIEGLLMTSLTFYM